MKSRKILNRLDRDAELVCDIKSGNYENLLHNYPYTQTLLIIPDSVKDSQKFKDYVNLTKLKSGMIEHWKPESYPRESDFLLCNYMRKSRLPNDLILYLIDCLDLPLKTVYDLEPMLLDTK
ncbi:hypothetical protein PSH49_21445 [Pseudoalteromonas sp. GABNS16G]|uniref:hypothetical protein n=1 Tax=Pseudoalteromonas sp. GABNS16G TaxID=3025324 RepID=UPI0023593D5C|nr:hypothetical protein [Pseudoalteromonas sp. GABNS16G]MDC9603147.1 hypothetical protein [Pseudoalteromonas sp. GABNS16G]